MVSSQTEWYFHGSEPNNRKKTIGREETRILQFAGNIITRRHISMICARVVSYVIANEDILVLLPREKIILTKKKNLIFRC